MIDITVSDTKARIPRRMRIHCAPATFFSRYLERHYRQTACIAMTSIAPRTRVHVHSDEKCNVHKDIERLSLRSGHDWCASRIRIFTATLSSQYYIKRFLGLRVSVTSIFDEYFQWIVWSSRKFNNDETYVQICSLDLFANLDTFYFDIEIFFILTPRKHCNLSNGHSVTSYIWVIIVLLDVYPLTYPN